ncbi:MAG: sulfotransferase domain-containing protein [Opitutales bacterium]
MLVICSGMKRSGSTWQFNAVSRLLEISKTVEIQGFLPDDEMELRVEELSKWANDPDTFHIVKTHAMFDSRKHGIAPEKVLTTYTYRDIRDAAVSIKRQFGADGQRLLDILDGSVEMFFWMRDLPNSILQRYEDFTVDPTTAVRQLADFMSLDADPGTVARVVDACSIESMKKIADGEAKSLKKQLFHMIWHINRKFPVKKMLFKIGFSENLWIKLRQKANPYDSKTLLRPGHVSDSKGASETWRDKLSADEIQTIESRFKNWFDSTEYALS